MCIVTLKFALVIQQLQLVLHFSSSLVLYMQGWGGSEIHDLSSLQILPNLGTGTELSSNFY